MLRYQELEDASKGREPISEVLSDTTQKIESPEPHITSHEVHNSLRRTSPHDSERSRSHVLSGPHSRTPSVRTLSPALSQGKVQADDEVPAGDAPHHTRRKFYVSCLCDRGLNPMLGTPATNFPFARVRVHSRSTDRPTTPTQPDKAVPEWPQIEDKEPSKLDARPLIAPYDNDSHVPTEKLGEEGDVAPILPPYFALTEVVSTGKRKAPVTEGFESPRDKKRMREQSEPADDDDTGMMSVFASRLSLTVQR